HPVQQQQQQQQQPAAPQASRSGGGFFFNLFGGGGAARRPDTPSGWPFTRSQPVEAPQPRRVRLAPPPKPVVVRPARPAVEPTSSRRTGRSSTRPGSIS